MTLDDYRVQIEARPTPTPQQWADARQCLETHAPDLLEYLFGERVAG